MRWVSTVRRKLRKAVALIRHPSAFKVAGLLADGREAAATRYLGARLAKRERRRTVGLWMVAEPDAVLTFERDGTTWSIPAGDEILPSVFADGGYEQEAIDAVLAWLSENRQLGERAAVIDVGAHVGTTTIPMAKRGLDVIAIEPVESTYRLLRLNINENQLADKVRTVNAAISGGGRQVEMAVGLGAGRNEIIVDGETTWHDGLAQTVSAAARGLDDVVCESGLDSAAVHLVWADVQGCETDVVRTGTALWQSGAPLFCEVDPRMLELHGGLDAFIEEAEAHFGSFVARSDLEAHGVSASERPIHELRRFADELEGYSDALLLPE